MTKKAEKICETVLLIFSKEKKGRGDLGIGT
jgi:hypothetical protein